MKTVGSLIVSWDFSRGENVGVLLVGEKKINQQVSIVNAFQGKEAHEIYKLLVTKPEVKATRAAGDSEYESEILHKN